MDESQERSQTLCEYRTLSPALWCVLFLFLTFALPGEKITAFMEFGQVWCGVSGGGRGVVFLDPEVGKMDSRIPQRCGREGLTRGLGSAGPVVCVVTDWVPRVAVEEVAPVQGRRRYSRQTRRESPAWRVLHRPPCFTHSSCISPTSTMCQALG